VRKPLKAVTYVLPYIHIELLGVVCALIAAGATMASPWTLKLLADRVMVNREMHMLAPLLGVFGGIVVSVSLFPIARNYLFTVAAERAAFDIRTQLFSHVQQQELSYFHSKRTGRLMSVIQSDVPVMQELYSTILPDSMVITMQYVASIGVIAHIDPQLALLGLICSPFFAIIPARFSRAIRAASRRVQERIADASEKLEESISGTREIIAYTLQQRELSEMRFICGRLLHDNIRRRLLTSAMTGLCLMVSWVPLLILYGIGATRVAHGQLSIGSFFALCGYFGFLFPPVQRGVGLAGQLMNALGAADRVLDVLAEQVGPHQLPDARPLKTVKGAVKFENVFFAYREPLWILKDVNLEVEPGTIVALVGPSGAGKSTLASLIPRFHAATSGRVMIDGQDVRRIEAESLRRAIAIVFQDPFLFATSVRENIRMSDLSATDHEVERAARIANAHEFIVDLPEGYRTHIGERGVKLSGGEKQRIAVARAVLRDPRILILDEATSSLDAESERLLREALDKLMQARTTFVIAHRLSTVLKADLIVVLAHGRIVEKGTHSDLLRHGEVYPRLYAAQLAST